MAFRFRKSVKLLPGLRVNLSKSGASLSVGGKGSTVNFSPKGARATFGLPGTGLSWSKNLGSPKARHRRPSRSTAAPASATSITSSAELRDTVRNPNAVVVYGHSGRKLSDAQLDAANRRFEEQERREHALALVESIEEKLTDVLHCWREGPTVPLNNAVYRAALKSTEFEFTDDMPSPPLRDVELLHFTQGLRAESLLVIPTSQLRYLLAAFLGIVVGPALYYVLVKLTPLEAPRGLLVSAAGGLAAAGLISFMVSQKTRNQRNKWVESQIALHWESKWKELLRQHETRAAAYEQARLEAQAQWTQAEGARVRRVERLLDGDLEVMHESIACTVSDLDFPFEAQAEVAISSSEEAWIHFDLPEIDDVIPEKRGRVLKDGRIKETKRKATERNVAYADLVTGLAFMVSAAAFTAAPTLRAVHLAAFTQRKQRGVSRVGDDYVYTAKVPREAFSEDVFSYPEPTVLLARYGTLEQKSNFALKKLKAPTWVGEFAGGSGESEGSVISESLS